MMFSCPCSPRRGGRRCGDRGAIFARYPDNVNICRRVIRRRRLRLLSGCGYIDNSYEARLIDLRQAITGRNFDRSDHKLRSHDDLICFEVLAAREALDTAIVDAQIAVVQDGGSFSSVAVALFGRCRNAFGPKLRRARATWRQWRQRDDD
jgi:hypothetical protein